MRLDPSTQGDAPIAYYTLYTRDALSEPFAPQFGDFVRKVVEEERRYTYPDVKARDWRIVKTDAPPSEAASMVTARELDGDVRDIRARWEVVRIHGDQRPHERTLHKSPALAYAAFEQALATGDFYAIDIVFLLTGNPNKGWEPLQGSANGRLIWYMLDGSPVWSTEHMN